MRRLLLISNDPLLEQHLGTVMQGVCTIVRVNRDTEQLRREIAEGASLIAIDGDFSLGMGSFLPEIIDDAARLFPGQPILVLGDESDASVMLRAIRAGARDVLDRHETGTLLRAHLSRHFLSSATACEGTGKLQLVLNSLPGSGGMYAINLAVLCARATGDGLLVDCTLPASLAGAALDMRPGYSVADAVQDMERMDRMLLASAVPHHPPSNLRVLPLAATATDAADRLSPEDILALINRLQTFFHETVVDTGSIRHTGMLRSLAERATAIHLVTPQTIPAVQAARSLLDSLDLDAMLLEKVTLAVDGHDPGILLTPEQMATTLGLKCFATIPAARVAEANALNAGQPLALAQPFHAYSRAMSKIAGLAPGEDRGPSLMQALFRLKEHVR